MIGRWRNGRVFWNVPAMPRSTTSHGASPVMSSPLKHDAAGVGAQDLGDRAAGAWSCPRRSGRSGRRSRRARSSKLTAFTAVRPPKRLVSSFTAKNARHAFIVRLAMRCARIGVDESFLRADGLRARRLGRSGPAAAHGARQGRVRALLPADPRAAGRRALPAGRGAGAPARGGKGARCRRGSSCRCSSTTA